MQSLKEKLTASYSNNFQQCRLNQALLYLELYFAYICMKKKSINDEQLLSLVRKTERSCFNSSITSSGDAPKNWGQNTSNSINIFAETYKINSYKIAYNIDPENEKNHKLLDSILSGDFLIKNIGYLSSFKLSPELYEDIKNEIKERSQQKVVPKISKQHKCHSCGQRSTIEIEKQIRSLDEGSSVFVICQTDGCGNTWKIGG